jgi:hypothetical protein
MTQAELIPQTRPKSEFRTALEIGQSLKAANFKNNPVVDLIKAFAEDKRVVHFEEDVPQIIKESIGETLDDVHKLQESYKEMDQVIAIFTRMKTRMANQADEIIQNHIEAGILEEGNFKLEPIEKRTNRKVNREVLLSEKFKKRYDALLDAAKEELDESFTPTVKAIEVTFGKKADEILIPGMVTIVGYELKPLSPMPEKASIEVEL